LRPSRPKAGCATGLRYFPNYLYSFTQTVLRPSRPKAGCATGLRYFPNCFCRVVVSCGVFVPPCTSTLSLKLLLLH
jgi:hypothetical protein